MKTTTTDTIKQAAQVVISQGKAVGGTKVWVIQAYIEACHLGYEGSVAEFKAATVAGQRAGEIKMSRCDLVEGFDPALVRTSECRYLGAEWHFIRL